MIPLNLSRATSRQFTRFITVAALAIPILGASQIPLTDVTSLTATPVPGVGHEYIHDLNEIVNPANGSVSIRIAAPTPHERAMNFPIYAYTYDSSGQFMLQMTQIAAGCNGTTCTGVGIFGPSLTTPSPWPSFPGSIFPQYVSLSFNNGPNNGTNSCSFTGNYVYVDLEGGRHNFNEVTNLSNQTGSGCSFFGVNAVNYGGDIQYKASGSAVIDSHGNLLGGGLTGGEDTNGNFRNGTGRPWSVTYGTGAQLYSPLSMTVPGYSVPYTYTYEAAPASFTGLNSTLVSSASSGTCSGPQPGAAGSQYALQKLNLPNGQYYEFGYEPVYGLVNSITYPTGATVSYTWGLNPQSDIIGGISNNSIGEPVDANSACYFIHDWPAVAKRVVAYNGANAQEQDFSYSTTWVTSKTGEESWTSKTTTVTTKDLLRPGQPSYQTLYTYTPVWVYPQSPASIATPSEMPVESQVVYKDTSGSTLRTVSKVWNQINQLAAECTTLPNAETSGKFYTYESFVWPAGGPGTESQDTDQVTDLQEYDFGQVKTPCVNPGGTPARETKTTFASLGNTPYWPSGQYMSDRPSTVQVYSNGTLISETDYSYDQTSVAAVSPTPVAHDESVYGASATPEPRGNATTITKKCFAAAGSCQNATTILTYDETGQVLSVNDPRGFTTTLSYTDSYTTDDGTPPGNTNTYLTKITRPSTSGISHVSTYMYDYEKGELRVGTDENGQVSKYLYNDSWDRPTQANFPDGGEKTYTYADAGPEPSISTTTLLNSGGATEKSTTILDSVGHTLYTELTSDPSGTDIVQNTYDGSGRLWTTTNPYRGASPPAGTTSTFYYDSLGRPIETVEQDGSLLQWCYDGVVSKPAVANCSSHLGSVATGTWVDSTDEDGNHWQRTSDGLGRLREVMEPSGTAQPQSTQPPSMETDYGYDALNDLLSVSQWGGANGSANPVLRSFSYDSLSRLIQASNPESGLVCYGTTPSGAPPNGTNCTEGYDANGNLTAKTDARGIAIAYTYDALNRLTKKSYSDGVTPTSLFVYDTENISFSATQKYTTSNVVGRLSVICVDIPGACQSMTAYSYDPMGRTIETLTSLPSNPTTGAVYAMTFGYDLAGNRTMLTNSTGRTFNYSFDTAGRLQTASNTVTLVAGTPVTTQMVDAMTYFPSGQPQTMTTDTGAATITGTWGVDNRLRTTSYQNLSTANLGNTNYGYSLTYTPNSSVKTDAETVYNPASGAMPWSWTYNYDTLNRVSSAISTGAIEFGCAETYDPFGNRTNQVASGGAGYSCTSGATPVVPGKNRLSGFTYDNAGNLLNDGFNTLTYDGEGRVATSTASSGGSTRYLYDVEGQRVSKIAAGVETDFVRDLDGTLLDTYVSGSYINQPQEMWIAGKHYGAVYVSLNNGVKEQGEGLSLTNWLGSEAMRSFVASSGNNTGVPSYAFVSQPFGDAQTTLIGGDHDDIHFTGKERDAESGNDYFGARYYASSMGRFMSPDWAAKASPVPYATFGDPQSLNLYAYMRNNPLGGADPDGHCDIGCQFSIVVGIVNGIQRDGSVGAYAKNVGIGILKGAGSTVVNTANLAAVGPNPGAIAAAVLSPGPAALQPSNATQAQASFATQVFLPAAAGPVVGAAGEAESVGAGTTSLFRAVDATELGSIQGTGQFLPSPSGTEYKGFFNTAEGAQSFSNLQSSSGGPPTTVVGATAPTDLVNGSPVHQAAQEAPGVLIKNENLPQVKPQ